MSRGFCSKCGTTLIWTSKKALKEVGITTGLMNEAVLIGTKTSPEGYDVGSEKRVGEEMGKALSFPTDGNLWFKNAVLGVTDEVRAGKKFAEGFEGVTI